MALMLYFIYLDYYLVSETHKKKMCALPCTHLKPPAPHVAPIVQSGRKGVPGESFEKAFPECS